VALRALALVALLVVSVGASPAGLERWLVAGLSALVLVTYVRAWRLRERLQQAMQAARVDDVLESLRAQTLGQDEGVYQLLSATALAAFGYVEQARRGLAQLERSAVMRTALEQRLIAEVLLDVFEGARNDALRKATLLELLPVPRGVIDKKIAHLRQGIASFVRAFSHVALPGDDARLRGAAREIPLISWAMRYAQAIVAIDSGRASDVAGLLAGAPDWPLASAYHEYHAELLARAAESPQR
jgi:hypothetical protein